MITPLSKLKKKRSICWLFYTKDMNKTIDAIDTINDWHDKNDTNAWFMATYETKETIRTPFCTKQTIRTKRTTRCKRYKLKNSYQNLIWCNGSSWKSGTTRSVISLFTQVSWDQCKLKMQALIGHEITNRFW